MVGDLSTKIFGCMAALILIERNNSNVCFGVKIIVFLLINLLRKRSVKKKV